MKQLNFIWRASIALCGVAAVLFVGPAQVWAQGKSVKPGINKRFLDPELQVGEWVERFEREGREVYDHRDAILNGIGLKPGMTVADIGSGTGFFTRMLSAKVGEQGRVIAVDIVPKFLSRIETIKKEEGLKNISTRLCTAKSTKLPKRSIDAAFICDTYHHFEFPQATLKSLHAALRPGGTIILIDFKRIAGRSSDFIMNHVRAGQEVFTAEIEAAGFEKLDEPVALKENYVVRFRKKSGKAKQ